MVRKKNGKWRMCMNFIDLNKWCPKDDFPLTRIDKIIDSAAGCEMMMLLDCFSGYHQIWLCKEDEEKTSFITPFGTFCYLRMPEGLRNVGPTFYRMTKAALKDQVDKNVLSYVDDIVVISKTKETYISDLAKTFINMHEVRLKLNPEKCIFEITKGKVLSCLVSIKGIEVNPDKIRALIHMQPPQSRKDVQKLTLSNNIVEPVRIEAGRTQPTIFCCAQRLQKIWLGSRAAKGLRWFKELSLTLANAFKYRTGATSHLIRLNNTLSS
jgi:hypothetical protein